MNWLLLGVILLVIIIKFIHRWKRKRQPQACGTIIEYKRVSRKWYYPIIEFSVNNKNYRYVSKKLAIPRFMIHGKDYFDEHLIGKVVTICYDPLDPTDAYHLFQLKDLKILTWRYFFMIYILPILGFIIMLVIFIIIYISRFFS